MKSLIQRVDSARVTVGDELIGEIGRGLLVLVGIEKPDGVASVERMAERLLGYRLFADDGGRMNRSVVDEAGGVLLVSQFTLAADTRKGTRPSFSSAAEPDTARRLFEALAEEISRRHAPVATGRFGADMRVSLVNDGPVTFMLES